MSTTCSLSEPNTVNANNESSNVSSNACGSSGETNSSRELKIFKKVIRDPVLRAPFQEFLEQQFCAENLNFYLAVEQFKEITDFQERSTFGRRIFDRYFAMNSTEPVNIDNSTSKRIRETVESGTFPCDTYDVAQYQILHLLKYDCWPRFLRSTSNQQPTFTDEELAADDDEKNGHSQQSSLNNTTEFEGNSMQSSQPCSNANVSCTKEKRKSVLWHGLDRFSRRLRRGDSTAQSNCMSGDADASGSCVSAAAGRGVVGSAGSKRRYIFAASKQYSMPAEMTSPVKKNSLSPTHLRRHVRTVEAKQCQLMVGDQFNTETVTLDDPTMSVRRWTQEMADSQGMDRLHTEVVDAETGSTIDPARQAIDALQSRALRLVPVVSFIVEFLPPNFSFKNPATTPTKLVCVRARHSLSTGAVLRPLLLKYTIDPNTAKIMMNGSLEQIKRSISVGMMAQKCLTIMTDAQYTDRVNAGKPCLPAPRDPILLQQPSVIYEQNNFQFHQHGDISYCEIPSETERSKHAHQQHYTDAQNASHQQKEYSLSLFNKFVRKASQAVSNKNEPSSSTSPHDHTRSAAGILCSPSTGTSSRAANHNMSNNIASSSAQVNSTTTNGESNKTRLSIFKNKSDKKSVKTDFEKTKARSEDITTVNSPSTSQTPVDSKPNGGSSNSVTVVGTPNTQSPSTDAANIKHPAIFSTKIGNESTTSSFSASDLSTTEVSQPSTSTKTVPPPVIVPPPKIIPPVPTTSAPSSSTVKDSNQRESTWQKAAYV